MQIGDWGYPNGQIPESAMVAVEGFFYHPEMAKRVAWAHGEIRRRGGTITTNEGYRPLGVMADRYVLTESATSTGGSNQWFQLGRMDRGETPSAATPSHSNHGFGCAEDSDTDNEALRAEVYAQAGLLFTIPSESWHADPSGDPTVTLDALDATPIKPKEDPPMARYIRNSDTSTIAIANIDTGLWYELPNMDYVALLDARNAWDRTLDLNIPANEYGFFKAVAASVRRP